ncbi:hypothetical protein DJ66_0673 [Candidatus Liberibacter solanacearum]|uniref:Uncharacterized protein n=1 Tax=Candidatus Liberibacter solanacearum TaxID=556287 RepID=A0A0F4VK98_9HYPH|nr:hypothetical protein DJ66_0673 [Candidatus Liberibacter solanacearum]
METKNSKIVGIRWTIIIRMIVSMDLVPLLIAEDNFPTL